MSSGLCCIKWIPESEHLAVACNPATTATLWVKVCYMSNNADYSVSLRAMCAISVPPPNNSPSEEIPRLFVGAFFKVNPISQIRLKKEKKRK